MADEWHYSLDGGQAGPCSEAQLRELIANSTIRKETPVWREGMTDWLPAGQIEGLITNAPQGAPSPAAPASDNPYAVSQSTAIGSAVSLGTYPSFTVKKASFKLHLIFGLIVPGIAFLILMVVMMGAGASASASSTGEPSDTAAAALGGSMIIVMLLFYGSMIASSIIGLVHLYRAWYCLQPGGARATPGQAVGFLFIPFFNLYWYFIAYKGLADDWNRIMDSHEDLRQAPRFESGIFLAMAICMIVFPLLGIVFYFMAHHQICKGINFMAERQSAGREIRLH